MSTVSSRRDFLLRSAAALSASVAIAQERRPNILFAIADDWGYNHAGVYGCDWIKTPNFDRVANEGVRFTNCFTSSFPMGLCAEMITAAVPSRNAGIMQRTTALPSAAVLPRKITRGASTVEITFTSIDAAAIGCWERLFFVATRTSIGVPEKN